MERTSGGKLMNSWSIVPSITFGNSTKPVISSNNVLSFFSLNCLLFNNKSMSLKILFFLVSLSIKTLLVFNKSSY